MEKGGYTIRQREEREREKEKQRGGGERSRDIHKISIQRNHTNSRLDQL